MAYLDELMATGETVQRVSRRHWIVLAKSLTWNGLGIAIVTLLAGVTTGIGRGDGSLIWPVVTALFAFLFLLFVFRLIADIVRWSSTQYAVTTRRVIEVSGIFNKVVRDSNLDKINDIVLAQSFLGRAMNYGDLAIITGSDIGVNKLEKLRDPIGFKRTMLDNKEDLDTLVRQIAAGDAS
jgi:uncharacterized membrane protein YdbT with pleckstrin-like domain